MVRKLFSLAAWASVGFIVYATLVPVHLRPTIESAGPDFERFGAYVFASGLMALAYPRYAIRIAFFMTATAAVLEVAQLATPDRDAHVVDMLVKMGGALAGTTAAAFCERWAVKRGLLTATARAG
jgi:hypothetical protein